MLLSPLRSTPEPFRPVVVTFVIVPAAFLTKAWRITFICVPRFVALAGVAGDVAFPVVRGGIRVSVLRQGAAAGKGALFADFRGVDGRECASWVLDIRHWVVIEIG